MIDEVNLRTSETENTLVSHKTRKERSIISVDNLRYPRKAVEDHLPVFWIAESATPPAAKAEAPPYRSECEVNLLQSKRNALATDFTARLTSELVTHH